MEEGINRVSLALSLPAGGAMEKDIAELMGQEQPLVFATVDLDLFDSVNKRFGREEGDRVIIETGRYFLGHKPAAAALYRAGGDQFGLIIADGTEKEEVFLLMEKLRAGFSLALPDGRLQTLTIGISAFPDDAETASELIRKADGAMVRGKRGGSNRVCLAREEKMVTKTAHYTADQLERLTKIAKREGMGEAALLREALDMLLRRYDG